MKMNHNVGIFGSASGSVSDYKQVCKELGENLADCAKGKINLITGGCPGAPHFVAEAFADRSAKNGYHRATVIGISPAMNLIEHMEKYHFPTDPFYNLVFTGMERKGRNFINTRSCSSAIFVAGRLGTLNEFTTFFDEAPDGTVIGILTSLGGIATKLSQLACEYGKREYPDILIIEDDDPVRLSSILVEKLFNDRERIYKVRVIKNGRL